MEQVHDLLLFTAAAALNVLGWFVNEELISMAKHGYVVFAPYYRGNEGGEGREDFGGEDRFDLFHAIPMVQSLEEVIARTCTIDRIFQRCCYGYACSPRVQRGWSCCRLGRCQ